MGSFVSVVIAMKGSINANDFGLGMIVRIILARMMYMLPFNVVCFYAASFFIASNGFISAL